MSCASVPAAGGAGLARLLEDRCGLGVPARSRPSCRSWRRPVRPWRRAQSSSVVGLRWRSSAMGFSRVHGLRSEPAARRSMLDRILAVACAVACIRTPARRRPSPRRSPAMSSGDDVADLHVAASASTVSSGLPAARCSQLDLGRLHLPATACRTQRLSGSVLVALHGAVEQVADRLDHRVGHADVHFAPIAGAELDGERGDDDDLGRASRCWRTACSSRSARIRISIG